MYSHRLHCCQFEVWVVHQPSEPWGSFSVGQRRLWTMWTLPSASQGEICNKLCPEQLKVTGDDPWGAAVCPLWLRSRVRSVRKELGSAVGSPQGPSEPKEPFQPVWTVCQQQAQDQHHISISHTVWQKQVADSSENTVIQTRGISGMAFIGILKLCPCSAAHPVPQMDVSWGKDMQLRLTVLNSLTSVYFAQKATTTLWQNNLQQWPLGSSQGQAQRSESKLHKRSLCGKCSQPEGTGCKG